MRSRGAQALFLATALAAGASAQVSVSGRIQLPPDSPVTLLSADWSESRSSQRGGAALIEVHTDVLLRNASQRHIRGLTLAVTSQEVAPGGRGSITKASLDVGPGDNFPVKIDLRLLRPWVAGAGPSVEITLDGVLFEDLSFYGPNKLDSRRDLTAWEMEAQRDRKFFAQVLAAQGPEGLKKEALLSLDRQGEMPRLDVRYARVPRATASGPERDTKLAFLHFPDSPVEPVSGTARIRSDVSAAPVIDLVNRSKRPVRSVDLGWLLTDVSGKEFLANGLPSGEALAPGARIRLQPAGVLEFSESPTGAVNGGSKLSIVQLQAFVNQVEFADGTVWIPSRAALNDAKLRRALPPSAEEQRLTTIYRKRGLGSLIAELKKFE
jgi:hypothetical protein